MISTCISLNPTNQTNVCSNVCFLYTNEFQDDMKCDERAVAKSLVNGKLTYISPETIVYNRRDTFINFLLVSQLLTLWPPLK